MAGTSKPKDLAFKDWMYSCFENDVAIGARRWNNKIPTQTPFHTAGFNPGEGNLRVVTFNVHFFRVGFSSFVKEIDGDSLETCLEVIAALSPDVLLLQEVPASLVETVSARLVAMGFPHSSFAGSADVHVLPSDFRHFPSERLHVGVAIRGSSGSGSSSSAHDGATTTTTAGTAAPAATTVSVVESGAVPMLDGHAAFMEVEFEQQQQQQENHHHPAGDQSSPPPSSLAQGATTPTKKKQRLLCYSVHLSVRCPAEKRKREAGAVAAHIRSRTTTPSSTTTTSFQTEETPLNLPLNLRHNDNDSDDPPSSSSLLPSSSSSSSPLVAPLVAPLVVVGGDLNQPNQGDYPAVEWAAISADLIRAGLPLSDGVQEALGKGSGGAGLTTTYDAAFEEESSEKGEEASSASRSSSSLLWPWAWLSSQKRIIEGAVKEKKREGGGGGDVWADREHQKPPPPLPALTAWNGAVVDYIWANTLPQQQSQPQLSRPFWKAPPPPPPPPRHGGSHHGFRVQGTWAYYTLASDHLPVVADFKWTPISSP